MKKVASTDQIGRLIKLSGNAIDLAQEGKRGEEEVEKILGALQEFKDGRKSFDCSPTYRVVVNYNRTLAEMIKAGNYKCANDDINATNFPVSGSGMVEREVVIFHFKKMTSLDEVITEMDNAGYRPAKIDELLALGEAHPELKSKFPIIALDSTWRHDSSLGVACLECGNYISDLNLPWLDFGWGIPCRVAAVRKYRLTFQGHGSF
jgi:hypothetical protein